MNDALPTATVAAVPMLAARKGHSLAPRWMKVLRDMQAAQGRLMMIVAAMAASIAGVVTMLSTYTVLNREVPRNYQSTNPASAVLVSTSAIDPALLSQVRALPNVASVELAATVTGRIEVSKNEWLPLLLFVVPVFDGQRINRQFHEAGAWPASRGTLLIERSAVPLVSATLGDARVIELPNAGRVSVAFSGSVQDPGVAPAWQEQTVYGYAEEQTLLALGEAVPMTLLRVVVRDGVTDVAAIARTARGVAEWLGEQGETVKEVRIPPPGRHPHQSQMNAVVMMLLVFSMLALLLGAVLTATVIGGLLAQQVRQVAIIKGIGARTSQIMAMYLAMVALLGVVAVLIGLPAGIAFGRGFVGLTAGLLNLRIESFELPWWLFAASIGLGVGAPVLAAFVPIWLAARRTVREAIADHGAATTSKSSGRLFAWMSTIPMPDAAISLASRNMFRRRGRLLLTSSLLAGSGAMFLTAMNLKAAWERNVAIAVGDSRYDAEIRLQNPAPSDRIAAMVSGMPGVAEFESWSSVAAAAARDSGPLITQQYPDGGHGGFVLREAPSGTTLIAHTMTSGRWLVPSDTNGVVLNNLAQALAFRRARVGDSIALDVADRRVLFRVVGITRELLTPGAAYVTPDAFARATRREQQTNAFRISVTAGTEPNAVTSAIAHRLEHEQIGVKTIISSARFAAAQGGHIYILVYALGFIASIMSLVGFLGLASSLGTSVVERTREFGVMRALGARSSAVMRMVLAEGVMTAALSWLAAWILASPLSNAVGSVLGAIASNDLVLRRTPTALLLWLVIVLVGATAVSVLPARRAARLTVRETLSHI